MQHLLLLHGAIGSNEQLIPLKEKLEGNFIVHTLNFSGHGGNKMPEAGFSIETFANDVLEYLELNNIEAINIFGYSMGGYVAMWLAKNHPEKINHIITLATKFYWDKEVAAKEAKMLVAETIETKISAFAASLKQRHAPNDWKEVLIQTSSMLMDMGENNPLKLENYVSIDHPCLLMLGDKDKMVTLTETVDVFKQLPNAQFCVLPATAHPIEQVNVDILTFHIKQFMVE
jgi:pimeloyl-ACP methyl ester carboxylesterase